MSEEFVREIWLLWVDDWFTSGTQDRRRELLDRKARIEVVLGWTWAPPFGYDNPPRIALTGGLDG